ncbi:MAG TPA: DEAD/DEAH box helicase, partial [Anaeromyxobacteraceae bacterium]|nr:DEAD/DEAH box helicase [Anaeromyxobacteraceae bacterium]
RAGLARAVAPLLRAPGRAATSTPAAAPALRPDLPPLPSERVPADADAAALAVVRGWIPRLGPVTARSLGDRIGLPPETAEASLLRLEAEGLVLRGNFRSDLPFSPAAPHWCERSVLARIHRLTLGRLRREIEPATAADFLRFLGRWQHVAPGTRLHGPRGLAEVVGQLQGFHAAAGAWERDLLPARVAGYEPGLLDRLCLEGEVAWGRLAAEGAAEEVPRRRNAPTRNAPVTLVLRDDLPWLLAAAGGPPPPLGPSALALAEALAGRGASFLSELAQATGRLPAELEPALWELVSAGVATCDGFSGLRTLVDPPARARVVRRPAMAGGRWSILRSPAPAATAPPAPSQAGQDALERLALQYLRRYGVVFRDLLARESRPPPWRDLVRIYRAGEGRGSLRGGRFVAGFGGEQFALPEAVDALRAVRRTPHEGTERLDVSAADPLNLVGILTPGARVPALLGNRVAYRDGVPENAGRYDRATAENTMAAPSMSAAKSQK